MIPSENQYKSGKYDFPSRDINPKQKGEQYCKENVQAIYSLFLRNKTAFSPKAYDSFNTLRLYSNGQQSTEKYKSWLVEDDTQNDTGAETWDTTTVSRVAKRHGWYNVLWDNVSPAPKIMSMIHGLFDDTEWDIFVDNIDRYSKNLLEGEKYMQIVQGRESKWQNEFKQRAGIPIDEDIVYPKSKEEFDMSVASDGFKLNIAKAMEKLIEHSFNVSRWDNVIKRKIVDDLAATGYAATRDYYDPEDGFFKTKYLDIAKLIIQYSIESDYIDAEYAGYCTDITISQLKQKRPDLEYEDIKKLAEKHGGYSDNADRERDWEGEGSLLDPSNQMNRYDEFKIPVIEGEWMDYDKEKRLSVTNVYGKTRYLKKDYDEEIKPLAKKQVAKGAKQKVSYITKRVPYQATWIIGSEIVFDYGRVQMAARPQPSKPRLSFHVEHTMQPSFIRQLKPILDNIQITWLKWQNSLAKMIERGYAVDIGMLQNVIDGEKKWKIGDLFKMWKETGILPFMQSTGGSYRGGDVTPIKEISGGLGSRLEESAMAMEHNFKLIEDLVGFNPASFGSTPDPNAAVRNVQAAMQSTNNVLKPVMKSILEIKQGVAETLMSRVQVGIRASKEIRDNYSGVVNDIDIELMRLADKDQVKYGLSMKPRPDAAFRQQLSEYVKVALQSGKDGRTGLEVPEAMLIDEQLYREGNISEIRQQISYMMRKNKEEFMRNEKENIALQNKGLQEMEQQKQQYESQSRQFDAQTKMNEMKAESQLEAAQKLFDANNELLQELIRQAGQSGEGVDNTDAKRRLSIALNVIGMYGMANIDLAQKIGEVEESVTPPTEQITGVEATISPPEV